MPYALHPKCWKRYKFVRDESIDAFLYALDQELDSEICVFDYGQYQYWRTIFPFLVENKILIPVTRSANEIACRHCGENVSLKEQNDQPYYHCAACGDVRRLNGKDVLHYQASIHALAKHLAHGLGIVTNPEPIASECLYRLGVKTFRAGQFTLYLARGVAREEGNGFCTACIPVQVKGFGVILSLYGGELTIPKERLMQVPLSLVLRQQSSLFYIDENLFAERLWSIFANIPKGKLQKERCEACVNWLQDRIADNTFQQGDKAAAFEMAHQQFGIRRDAMQDIWGKVVPETFQRAGRRKKSY